MEIKNINPFYSVDVKSDGTLNVFYKLRGKTIFKGHLISTPLNEKQINKIIKKISEILNHKIYVNDDNEADFLHSLYNYVDLLDEELKLTTDYGEHLKAWLYNTSLDEVRILKDNKVRVKHLLKSDSTVAKKEAIVVIDGEEVVSVHDLMEQFSDYQFLYFVNEKKDSITVGPFINNTHMFVDNLSEILKEVEVETIFLDEQSLNKSLFRKKLIMGMIIERSSDFLLSQTPLHNRQVKIIERGRIILGRELALI